MKKIGIATVLFLYSSMIVYGQLKIKDQNILNGYNNLPKESVFVHHNASLLLAGEHLYYKMYCLDKKTNNLSSLSKMGYVELVGKNGITMFKHKVRLQLGLGYGDFLVPTTVPSGSYKLLGYTQWMQNDDQDYFFQADINIINPYQVTESVFPEKVMDSLGTIPESIKGTSMISKEVSNPFVSLLSNGEKFSKRKLVSFTVKNMGSNISEGNYSISVRKKDAIEMPKMLAFEDFPTRFLKKGTYKSPNVQDEVYLPELRGELITGKVTDKDTNKPVANIVTTLSLAGEDFIFDTSKTNGDGVFYFNLNEEYPNENAVVQLLSMDRGKFNVVLEEQYNVNVTDLEFTKLVIDEGIKDFILKRSIYNQIENAYTDVKQNKITTINNIAPFYRKYDEVYNLDDYTRFSSLEETLVEIIDHVWVRKNGDDGSVFQIRPPLDHPESNLSPLVIIDGNFIQHHGDIMGINARSINSIGFSRNRFLMGAHTFQGILSFETIRGDYNGALYRDGIHTIDLFKPLPQKTYFMQTYEDGAEADHVPDFRHQLLWQPNLKIGSDENTISFYTSDVTGVYEVCLEGITKNGQPVSIKETILVE